MHQLFPEVEADITGMLATDSCHQIYYEASGNPEGIPIVFLHGGPGSGCKPDHRRYFDKTRYRIIIFDQRGCGRSIPTGVLQENNTQFLLDDIEALRRKLGIDSWVVFGGSWGSTLALLYAEQHPSCVRGLILRGTFLARNKDLDWFLYDGAPRLLPHHWQRFKDVLINLNQLPVDGDILTRIHKLFFHSVDKKQKILLTQAWQRWSGEVALHSLGGVTEELCYDIDIAIAQTSIELHYAYNRYFIHENQILDNLEALPNVPVALLHGWDDLVCPIESSWTLAQAIPHAERIFVAGTGHLASEPKMVDALIQATNKMAQQLSV